MKIGLQYGPENGLYIIPTIMYSSLNYHGVIYSRLLAIKFLKYAIGIALYKSH